MAKMKLYYSPSSPYARKVRVLAIETKLDKKIEMVNVALTPVAPNADVDKHNPIGKIPALSVKGIDLFDSPVICEYLDTHHKGRKLFPRKGRGRWVALRLQNLTGEKQTQTVTFTGKPAAARAADPVEHPGTALSLSGQTLSVDVQPLEIRTVLVRFAH